MYMPGGQVVFSYDLMNNGELSAGQNASKIYLNSNPNLTGAVELDIQSFSSVAGNSSQQISRTLNIPGNTSSGTKYLLVEVDANEQVAESDENNNLEYITVTVISCPTISVIFPAIVDESCEQENGSITASASGGSSPYSFSWETFPQQSGATAINLSSGTYTVNVTDNNGCEATGQQSIVNVGEVPLSDFTFSAAGASVSFTSTSSNADTYSWDFGDGNTSIDENPTHIYSNGGTYNVCLTVDNDCGSDNSCQSILVNVSDYSMIESASGVSLYERINSGDDPDYMQVVDLSAGAYIEFDHGDITSGGGTSNPFFTRESISTVWTEKTTEYDNVFTVTNGQFFDIGYAVSAPLAFPVKQNGEMVSDGYGNTSEYVGEKEFFGAWTDLSNITPYDDDPNSVATSTALHGIVGLDKDADKGPNNEVGRTFMGVMDEDGDGEYEKVLIFTSKTATQAYAAQQLNDFGVSFDKILMLDGGGSTQMRCNGVDYVSSTRIIPQFIVVYSATNAVPECTQLTNPVNGSFDVPVDEELSWNSVPDATGYKLTIGTTSGGTNILDYFDVGNVTSYDPGDFPYGNVIFCDYNSIQFQWRCNRM
ncbi:MAG: PKD domain-containing protein [Saprospiraceae bacterium]